MNRRESFESVAAFVCGSVAYRDDTCEEIGARPAGNCELTKPGRGDCSHFVGLPGTSIPGQHDGPDDTVDAYGKPNGWCWQCWKSEKIRRLEGACRTPPHLAMGQKVANHAGPG